MSKTPQFEADPESTIDWLNRLLRDNAKQKTGEAEAETSEYVFRPNADEPQLLIPLGIRAVAAASLRRFHDSRSLVNTVASTAAPLLGHPQLLRHTGGEVKRVRAFDLVQDLAAKLGEPELSASIILGPQRRNRKPVLQLIRSDGVVIGFAKVGWSPLTTRLVTNERNILLAIDSKLPPEICAPLVLHHETDSQAERQIVVVTSAVSNGPFARRKGPLSLDFVCSLARSVSPGRLPIGDLPYLDMWRRNETLAPLVRKLLLIHDSETECEVGLWHGDLTPWNTSTTKHKMVIWDWEFAGLDRPIGFDLLHDIFETHRRSPKASTGAALKRVVSEGLARLAPFSAAAEAILDLYLCELLHRETELEGQRWESETISSPEKPILALLRHRLGFNT